MKKLYKKDNKGNLLYAIAWFATIHTGKVGKKGNVEEYPLSMFDTEADFYNFFDEKYLSLSYKGFPDNEKHQIVVQYKMKSLKGNKRDHWLREAVTNALNSELGWTGLGNVDGFDMGSTFKDTKKFVLNIFCIVVDENKGITAIKRGLRECRLDYTQVKIASKPYHSENEYQLKFSAKKNDLNFCL